MANQGLPFSSTRGPSRFPFHVIAREPATPSQFGPTHASFRLNSWVEALYEVRVTHSLLPMQSTSRSLETAVTVGHAEEDTRIGVPLLPNFMRADVKSLTHVNAPFHSPRSSNADVYHLSSNSVSGVYGSQVSSLQ
jgi:hypothetical protein